MNKDNENLVKAIEEEIERVEYHMYEVLGLDREKVEELYRLMDIALEKEMKERFDNLAEVKTDFEKYLPKKEVEINEVWNKRLDGILNRHRNK